MIKLLSSKKFLSAKFFLVLIDLIISKSIYKEIYENLANEFELNINYKNILVKDICSFDIYRWNPKILRNYS